MVGDELMGRSHLCGQGEFVIQAGVSETFGDVTVLGSFMLL